ncbi:hypothetical protein J4403_01615 [Candidatus Woesearchaeota archaeon]|nr:hypothetical protein [Candidatus Woesearchaeota archaeon]
MKILTGSELLKKVYIKLQERYKPEIIKLDPAEDSEIANDSDLHRTRIEYMSYNELALFDGHKKVVMSLGTKTGAYPGEQFLDDLIAVNFNPKLKDKELEKSLRKSIRCGTYFKNTLFFVLQDGLIGATENKTAGRIILEDVTKKINQYLFREPKYNKEVLSLSDLSPVNTSPALYKSGLVDLLVKKIEDYVLIGFPEQIELFSGGV